MSAYWFREGARCVQIGGRRRHGVILCDMFGGYVDVIWDSGKTEALVHIRDIRPEAWS